MIIEFSPARSDIKAPRVEIAGDTITINDEAFDFARLPDDAELPSDAITSDWFTGPVRREGGELRVSILLPIGHDAPEAARFPKPVSVINDGVLTLPGDKP